MIAESVKITNIDNRLLNKFTYINSIGLVNTVSQYEMDLEK